MRYPRHVGAVVLLVMACAGSRTPRPIQPPPDREPSSTGTATTAVGVIYLAGNDPSPMLALRDDLGAGHRLAGPLSDELRRLSGARVRVSGRTDSTATPPWIEAIEYEVLEIDGHRPRVGELRQGPQGLWLLTPDSMALEEPTGRLETLAGAKVWVVADTASRPALVQSFGLIREPPP
jgi:hypothetical protein